MKEDPAIRELVRILYEERRLDLRAYKQSTLERRIRRRMADVGAPDTTAYVQKVREDPQEINNLLNTVLINVTEFFRDPMTWEYLQQQVLTPMFDAMKPGEVFRAWSAGCSTGEEAYSLAILVAEHFGPRLRNVDIRIYATEVDEEALQVARRGEYPAERLRRMRPEWRQKYFQGKGSLRVNRELRRLVVFGRSNLVSDAPISHCKLVVCRNVLIFFKTETQVRILNRLHYALEPGGVLFLGKAESKLGGTAGFRPLNLRWRIFQRSDAPAREIEAEQASAEALAAEVTGKSEQELRMLKAYQRHLLETVKSGVIILDKGDIITLHNAAAALNFGVPEVGLLGKRLQHTELAYRCPKLAAELEASHTSSQPAEFECRVKFNGEEKLLSVWVRPVTAESGERTGTIIYTEDISDRDRWQGTVEQLEATSEELQSANEELETTNEELQSTNEELETTNEELQSTNEELETTNEELQSLNEELAKMNDELEARTRELNSLSSRYAETLRRMPWPVMIVGRDQRVQLWNAAAQRLFGVGETSVAGVEIDQLPMNASVRQTIVRETRGALRGNRTVMLHNQLFRSHRAKANYNVQFTPITGTGPDIVDGVLIIFTPLGRPLPSVKAPSKLSGDHLKSSAERKQSRKAAANTKLRAKTKSNSGRKS